MNFRTVIIRTYLLQSESVPKGGSLDQQYGLSKGGSSEWHLAVPPRHGLSAGTGVPLSIFFLINSLRGGEPKPFKIL